MSVLRKLLAAVTLAVICVCVFGGFSIPQETEGDLVRIYSQDGRILDLEPAAVAAYLNDGWTEDYNQVSATVWKPDGSSMRVLKSKVGEYVSQGWAASKEAVTVTMEDEAGRQTDVFAAQVQDYEEVGWAPEGPELDPNRPAIALTFDDGPNAATTNHLLNVLEENGARATFFVLGNRVSGGADCIRRMKELGMEVGSHTYDHKQLTSLGQEGIQAQIDRTNASISAVTGENPTLMRPPYGAYNATVKAAAGTPLILWSVDTLDWKTKNTGSVYQAGLEGARDGAVLLFHDIYDTTVNAMDTLIPTLQAEGYQLVTVSELARLKGTEMVPGGVYGSF